jgi:MYND finger
MSKLCKRTNCTRLGTKHCSACQSVWYCSVECQRANWKDHKVTCGKKLLTESELSRFLSDKTDKAASLDLSDREGKNINFLKGAVLFAEYQFADLVAGEAYHRLKNGVVFKNDWLLFNLRDMLTESYINQNTVASFDIALGYATETRAYLEMRRIHDDDRKMFYHFIYRVNSQLGHVYMNTMRNVEALFHMEEALKAARIGETQSNEDSTNLIQALKSMADIHSLLKNGEAAKYAEEAYILVSGKHGPEHPDVQGAATYLIDSCVEMGNFIDAERFARINYECLIDPNNKVIRKAVAIGKMQMARVWLLTPPDQRIGGPEAAEEAEKLSREACAMLESIPRGEGFEDPITSCLSMSHGMLGEVMMERGSTSLDVEKTLLKALSLTHDCRVGVVPRVEGSSHRYDLLRLLGSFYLMIASEDDLDKIILEKARYAFEETVIIATAIFGPEDPFLLDCVQKIRVIDELLRLYAVDISSLGIGGKTEGGSLSSLTSAGWIEGDKREGNNVKVLTLENA